MKHVVIGAHLLEEDVTAPAVALAAGGIFLSGLPLHDDQPMGDRELLLRVAGVRASLLERATFVAIRYGFTAAGAADAEARCATHLARWKELLEQNRGNVEMTLKAAASSPQPRPDRRSFDSGAPYLRALHEATRGAAADPAFREAAGKLLAAPAVAWRWIPRDEKSVELALLVRRDSLGEVRTAGETLRREFPGHPFLLSGPWPLEVFADADHE